MVLLGLISIASFLTLPTVDIGKVDVRDLIMYVFSYPRCRLTDHVI